MSTLKVPVPVCRDSVIYSATCRSLADQPIALKVYNKGTISNCKLRAVKREAAILKYLENKK